MSNRYKGAIISATPPTTTGGESGVASGAWTLEQQMQLIAAGLWPSQPLPKYIEDVFSTYLYTGTGATQTITNGIDLSTKGGLVWIKSRSAAWENKLTDTVRGVTKGLISNSTGAETTDTTGLTTFNTTGFVLGSNSDYNYSGGSTYVSWTFREQAKFFDVVTWTGSNDVGTSIGRGIVPHNLGSAPGCVIIKNVTQGSTNWIVYHRSLSGGYRVLLNTTDAQTNASSVAYFSKYNAGWVQTDPDATNIYVGYNYQTNGNGDTLVAYLFAHDAGGFGLTGTDNVISCGSFTTDGSGNAIVSLGYEPQWMMLKTTGSGGWFIRDTMRGFVADTSGTSVYLAANTSSAEGSGTGNAVTATGTQHVLAANTTYIYIAIRRGPMKVPTTGTSVYNAIARTGTGANATVTGVGFASDWVIARNRTGDGSAVYDRLRGNTKELCTAETAAEYTITDGLTSFASMDGVSLGADATNGRINYSPYTYINWFFKRAPSFMDVVCYTGNGSSGGQTLSHNLTVAPELIICKSRSNAFNWRVYSSSLGVSAYAALNLTSAFATDANNPWKTPTTTTFGVGDGTYWSSLNQSGATFVAYLFATCAGVSKVGSYSGNTSNIVTVNCGFTGGARFVLIKRTDSTDDWYVWDSARGITSGNDPYLLLNSTAAEVTSTNYVDTDSTGFKVTAAAPAGLNASGGTYIFLAIA